MVTAAELNAAKLYLHATGKTNEDGSPILPGVSRFRAQFQIADEPPRVGGGRSDRPPARAAEELNRHHNRKHCRLPAFCRACSIISAMRASSDSSVFPLETSSSAATIRSGEPAKNVFRRCFSADRFARSGAIFGS